MEFTKELVSQIKKYFKEMHGDELTDDEANQYLSSLAKLFLAFQKIEKRGVGHD